jgi:hypothetical protein
MIDVRIVGDEVLLRLDQLPRKIRREIANKFRQEIFPRIEREITAKPPGKYIDPNYIQSGVEQLGSTLIGFVEIEDKPGVYSILPHGNYLLRNKPQQFVAREVHKHPYLKGAPVVARYLAEQKPWIAEDINDAVIEAINAR